MSSPAHTAPSLKALAEDKEVSGVTKATTFRVDPNLIDFEEGFNLRFPTDQLKESDERLFHAMKAGAFIPPVDVSVVNGKMIARDGHRRIAAAKRIRAEMEDYTLECRQLRGSDSDAVLHMLGTGTGGLPLTPLEAGRGYLRLVNMGVKPGDIATKLGVSRVTIDNGLTLAEAPQEVQNMVINGEVSSTTAREAIRQGAEGVAALVEAGKTERAKPKTVKKSKKKKAVTAATLKGTKAEKKAPAKPTKKEAAAEAQPELPIATYQPDPNSINQPSQCLMSIDVDEVGFKVKKDVAKATADFLRAFTNADDKELLEMASILELALM